MGYIAYLEQESEGCDYSIGCGLQVLYFKEDCTLDEIIEKRQLAKLKNEVARIKREIKQTT